MIQGITKYNKIILVVFALVVAGIILYMYFHIESFLDSSTSTSASTSTSTSANTIANLFNDDRYEKNRTLLYGSLFLDKLDEQIKGMTDPQIQYDTKRIDIIKYADVLL